MDNALYPSVSFRLSDTLNKEITERVEEASKSASTIAKRDLERYYEMLTRSLPQFSMEEAMLICDVLNSTRIDPHTASLLWAEISDALQDGYAEKYSIQRREAFVARLRALTPFECLAVVDAVERAWNGPEYQIKDMHERIHKVGLVK